MMKSCAMAFLIMISVLLAADRSSGRLLMKNTLFIFPDNPSAFNPNLNSFISDESTVHTPYGHVGKEAVDCDQETSPWKISSAQKTQSPTTAGKLEGSVTPFGHIHKVNSKLIEQRLSKSGNSHGVGHMQMIRLESQRLNGDILESHHSHGDDLMQPKMSNKRKLGSSPSPGGGHPTHPAGGH